ncbi:MAG: hypothetical protein Q9168_006595 [Polycauliona sp. 1 TL-2023]
MNPHDHRFQNLNTRKYQPKYPNPNFYHPPSRLNTEQPLFILSTGTSTQPSSTLAIHTHPAPAVKYCKSHLQKPAHITIDETHDPNPYGNESLIDVSTQIIEISGRSKRRPHKDITFTIQRCGPAGMSDALRAWLADGKGVKREELWVLYEVAREKKKEKVWRVLIDRVDAEGHWREQAERVRGGLAIRGVPFRSI